MVKKNSGSNNVVARKKKEGDVSCWNCFTVELIDKDLDPVPLSAVRKVNREKFKLYSIIASEISRPKAVSFKQKVGESYSIGKKVEEKLTKDAEQIDGTKLDVPESEESAHTDDEQHLEFEKSKIEIISDSDNGSSDITHNKPLIETVEKDTNSEIKHYSPSSKIILSKTGTTSISQKKSPLIKRVSFGNIRKDAVPENNLKTVIVKENLNKSKTDLISSDQKEIRIKEKRKLSFVTPKSKTFTDSENKYSDLKRTTSFVKPDIEILSDDGNKSPVIKVNTLSTPEIVPAVKKESLKTGKEISAINEKKNMLSKTLEITSDLKSDSSSIKSFTLSTSKIKSTINKVTDDDIGGKQISITEKTEFKKGEAETIEENLLASDPTIIKTIPNSDIENSVIKENNLEISKKITSTDDIELPIAKNYKTDNKTTIIIKETLPHDIALPDDVEQTSVGQKTKLPSKTFENEIIPFFKITSSEIVTIPNIRTVYPIKEEQNSTSEESKIETTLKDEDTSNLCLKTASLTDDEIRTPDCAVINSSLESSTIDIVSSCERNSPVIVHKVQIETSTPKPLKCEVIHDDVSQVHLPTIVTLQNKDDDVEEIIEGIQNISLDYKTETVLTNDKTDNSSSNGSESGYAGSSMRDLNDIDMPKSLSPKPDFSDSSEPSTPIQSKRDALKCLRGNFKSSLPVLTANHKRNILKSSKSMSGDSTSDLSKPVKSLRWSTLGLPRKSKDDDVYSGQTSPGYATLPRPSNSPLPHERDMLDRDRFPHNRSGLQVRSESMASVYSGAGEGMRGTVTVRGDVQISLLYNYRLGALEVGVKKCRDLAPVDTKRNRSDPYVKVYLLPDKSKAGKRKTKVKKNTLNPAFEETLSFVQPLASLSSRTLWLSVWHADMFGRNDFLGEVTLPLADVVYDDPAPMWYKLHERTEQFECEMGSRGELIVGLKLEIDMGRGATLHVLVKEAKNLQPTKPNGLADVFCKSYLLPERGRLAKQKTVVARRTLNPSWEHTFTYRGLKLQELTSRALELSLWDRDRLASNDFMGAVRLSHGTGTYMGASVNWMDSVGKEVTLWQRMMEHPNLWVEGSLPLRPQLNN